MSDEHEIDFSGMTVNERLGVLNLFDDYDKAILARNSLRLIDILRRIEVPDDDIAANLKSNSMLSPEAVEVLRAK